MLFFVILIYEIFRALHAEFCKQGITSAIHNQSALERKIFSSGSNLDLLFSIFGAIARINGIVFLVYLGYKTIWWHSIVIWIIGLVLIILTPKLFRGKTGITIPAFLAFLILPVSAAYLWHTV